MTPAPGSYFCSCQSMRLSYRRPADRRQKEDAVEVHQMEALVESECNKSATDGRSLDFHVS